MPTYFAAGGLDAYELSPTQPRDGGDAAIDITGGLYTYADAVLIDPASGGPAALAQLWTHLALAPPGYIYDRGRFPLAWRSTAGDEVMHAEGNSTQGMTFRYRLPDGTMKVLGDYPGLNSGSLDVLIAIDTTAGRLALFWNGGLLVDQRGIDTSGMEDIARIRLRGASGYDGQYVSDVIAASYCTIGHRVRARRPQQAGTAQEWAGDVSAIAKGAIDDSTAISASAAGQKATYTGPALAAPAAGNVVKAVAIAARLRHDEGDAPQNVRAILRVAGVDYPAAHLAAIGVGFSGSLSIFDVDPVTGQPWTGVDHANGEFGFEAVT